MAETRFPARLELLCENPVVLLDGAHNPHGAKALERVLCKHKGATVIVGMLADKNSDEVLEHLLPYASRVITVPVDNPRALSSEALAEKAKKYCADTVAAGSITQALELSRGAEEIFIFGSLYLASEIREKAKQFYLAI